MAAKIQVIGDTIKINKVFMSSKDRVAVNDRVVFEGKLRPGEPQKIRAGEREYEIEFRKISKVTGAIAIHLNIHEKGELLHTGIYDQAGKPVTNEEQAKKSGAIQFCVMIGAVVGVTTMVSLSSATGVVPGGAVGGAIGGGVGGMLGLGIGTLIFGLRKK